jgi:hypothetical protein
MEPIIGGLNINGLVSYLIHKDKRIFNYFNDDKIDYQNITKKQIYNFLNYHDKKKIIEKAKEYHGRWASFDDLENCSNNQLLYFGNHFFNHYNSLNLSNDEIKFQFYENKKYLDKLNNSVNLFSYPYGKPKLFFKEATNNLIKSFGVEYIFTSNPVNYSKHCVDSIYDRLPMHNFVDSSSKIKEHIVRPKLNNYIRKITNK